MATGKLAKQVGNTVRKRAGEKQLSWYTPFMAAASRAISHRIPLVDFVLDVRDARVPLSSECELLKTLSYSSRRIIVFNKLDLANRSLIKEWISYFQQQNLLAFGVNSHNKVSIQQFLNFLQSQVRALRKPGPDRNTITMMLVGIPNVGKSALANALHQIGRISATEKGKLKHAVVSPLPGETRSVSSLKVASHPNIYVLDTPGLLPAHIADVDVCAKLALTGALRDSLAGEKALSQYFLSVLNLSNEFRRWEKLPNDELPHLAESDNVEAHLDCFKLNKMPKEEFSTDHTKDSVVLYVRRSLFGVISSFKGDLLDEEDLLRIIQAEFEVLRKAFNLPIGSEEDTDHKVGIKLLNLYRTGRLGHYVLDSL